MNSFIVGVLLSVVALLLSYQCASLRQKVDQLEVRIQKIEAKFITKK